MPNKETRRIEILLNNLLNAKLYLFTDADKKLSSSRVPIKQGVYIIYSPTDKVLHVGRTLRGRRGLQQRLRNHLRGQSSFARNYLDGYGIKLCNGYKFRFMVIENARERALLEALATGKLCPEHLGLGKSKNNLK